MKRQVLVMEDGPRMLCVCFCIVATGICLCCDYGGIFNIQYIQYSIYSSAPCAGHTRATLPHAALTECYYGCVCGGGGEGGRSHDDCHSNVSLDVSN